MAFLKTERALCNKMSQEFDALISPVILGKQGIKQATRNLKNQLQTMVNDNLFSPDLSAVNSEAEALKNSANELYPGDTLDEMEAMKNLIDNCEYLSLLSPIANVLGTILGIFDQMADLVNGSSVPEFGAAGLGSLLDDLLNGIPFPGGKGIGDILRLADKLIECLSTACGAGDVEYIILASDYATRTNDLYQELGVVSNPLDPNYGKFDYDTLYTDVGMNLDEQTKFSAALDGVTDMKTNATDAIDKSTSLVKELSKTGFF